jgi:hypothetical protein
MPEVLSKNASVNGLAVPGERFEKVSLYVSKLRPELTTGLFANLHIVETTVLIEFLDDLSFV